MLLGNTVSGPSAVVVELKDAMSAVDSGLHLERAETGGADWSMRWVSWPWARPAEARFVRYRRLVASYGPACVNRGRPPL